MRKLILFFILLVSAWAVNAQQTSTFTPNCTGTAATDTTAISNLITIITTSARTGTLKIPYTTTRCVVNNLTIPAGVTLDFASNSVGISISTGQTLTIVGPVSSPSKQVFYNATAALGTISFSGNTSLTYIDPAWWGVIGVAHGGTPVDESAGMLATLAAWYTAKGGTIQFGARKYRFDSSLLIPNDGASPTPGQPSLRITGAGASFRGQGGDPVGGTIIDLRYNSTLSKIDTRGLGLLEIDRISFIDGGASSSVPFLQTTNTTLHVHDTLFLGNTASTPTQDAIVLGNTSTALDPGFDSPFQGYKTIIKDNYFNRIQRGVYVRTYGNAVTIRDNQWWTQCGATTGAAAVEFTGTGTNAGNEVTGNLVEMDHYAYGMKFGSGFVNNNLGPNGFFDAAGGVTAYYRFESGAQYNKVVDGMRNDAAGVLISEGGTALNSNGVDTVHQGQPSTFPQPVHFYSGDVSAIGDSSGITTQNTAGDKWQLLIANTAASGKPLSLYFTPNGGALEDAFQFQRTTSTVKRFFMGGSVSNAIFSNAHLDLWAATGSEVHIGTVGVPQVQTINGSGTSTALPFTSTLATGTAPFPVSSTTVNPNFNAALLNGATFSAPSAIGGGIPAAGTFTTLIGSISVMSALYRSTVAKVLLQGTGTGPTQISSMQTTPPTCTSNCGTSPSVAGSDSDMRVTMGASGSPASGFVITFNGTWAAAPVCSATMATTGMVVGKLALTVVTTTTTITIVTNGTAPANSDTYAIMCRGLL